MPIVEARYPFNGVLSIGLAPSRLGPQNLVRARNAIVSGDEITYKVDPDRRKLWDAALLAKPRGENYGTLATRWRMESMGRQPQVPRLRDDLSPGGAARAATLRRMSPLRGFRLSSPIAPHGSRRGLFDAAAPRLGKL